jgi:hypothetical protein
MQTNTGYEFKTARRRRIRRLLWNEEVDEPTDDAEENFRIHHFLRETDTASPCIFKTIVRNARGIRLNIWFII